VGVDSGQGPTAAPGFDSTFEPVHSEDRKGGMGESHNRGEQEQDHLSYPLYSSAQASRDWEKVAMDRFVDQTDFELRLVGYGVGRL
jgi:hypothetical protein